ncbi:hypothetical protein GCM10027052_01550 [Parafrigoribacterium mesophilum]
MDRAAPDATMAVFFVMVKWPLPAVSDTGFGTICGAEVLPSVKGLAEAGAATTGELRVPAVTTAAKAAMIIRILGRDSRLVVNIDDSFRPVGANDW